MNKIIFNGVAQVYLQGNNGLEVSDAVLDSIKSGKLDTAIRMDYTVFTAASNLHVKDYRTTVNLAAMAAISGGDVSTFAIDFNQPAHVTVEETDGGGIEISIKEPDAEADDLTLWLGSIDDARMAVQKETIWEQIIPVEGKFAFAALVR